MTRKKTTSVLSIILVTLLVATNSLATPRLSGAGAETCSHFLHRGTRASHDRPALQWVMGYLTGRAVATSEGASHKSFRGPEGIASDVVAYCRKHPRAQIDEAAASFFETPEAGKLP